MKNLTLSIIIRKWVILFCLIITLGLSSKQANATHIVGGELNYTYLGNDSFYIKIKVYRDSLNAIPYFDDPLEFHVYDNNNQYINTYFIPIESPNLVVPQIDDSCFVEPPNVIVDYVIYEDTLYIPGVQTGWKFSYMRCCRNNNILNINSRDWQTGEIVPGESTGALYPAIIPNSTLNNSNPEFNTLPPVAICAFKQLAYDHSATDRDGDSLVYRLCVPFTGATPNDPIGNAQGQLPPFQQVLFIPPYSLANVMGGVPLAIDPHSGLLTAVPNTLGRFVISVCVDEYRDGQFLDEHRRDFQFNVVDCSRVFDADFEIVDAPKVDTISPFNILVCNNNLELHFNNLLAETTPLIWNFGDGTTSTEQNPFHTFPALGSYEVMLIAGPGEQCSDTMIKTINVQTDIAGADFNFEIDPCLGNSAQVQFMDASAGTQPIVNWEWVFDGEDEVFSQNAMNNYYSEGNYDVTLFIFGEGGCCDRKDTTINIELLENFSLKDTVISCNSDSVQLPLLIDGVHSFSWSPAAGLNDPTAQQPFALPNSTQQYIVTIATPNPYGGANCIRKDTTVVVVNYPPSSVEAFAIPSVLATAGIVELFATQDGTFGYSWTPSEVLNDPIIYNPIANIETTTIFEVTITDSNGCRNRDTALVVILDTECALSSVFIPTAFSPNGDGLNDLFRPIGAIIESIELVIYDRWGNVIFRGTDFRSGWDGKVDNEVLSGDSYGYIMKILCIGKDSFIVKGNVSLMR